MSASNAASLGHKLGLIGQSFYFHPDTLAVGKEHDLDGFRFYALGRGGVLGDVEPAVVQSAFGYFEGGLVAHIWNTAREKMDPRTAGAVYMECARNFGRANFAEIEGLEDFCDAGEALMAAIDPSALALYAGTAAEPLCDDTAGRAMQIAVALREWRGSVHLAAIVAEGLPVPRAHYAKRPDDYATFGYKDTPEAITNEERAAHTASEDRTNAICGAVLGGLSEDHAAAFSAGVDAMASKLELN